jgi:hypothetical protein
MVKMAQRSLVRCFLLWGLILGFPNHSGAQSVTYSHPVYDMGFIASPSWENRLVEENGRVWQVVNPNRNMQVNLSFIKNCTNPGKELEMISGTQGLICEGRPYDTVLNNRKALIIKGVCVQGRAPFRRLMIGIPGDEGLYVMEICCPEECYASHRKDMLAIMDTFWVGA